MEFLFCVQVKRFLVVLKKMFAVRVVDETLDSTMSNRIKSCVQHEVLLWTWSRLLDVSSMVLQVYPKLSLSPLPPGILPSLLPIPFFLQCYTFSFRTSLLHLSNTNVRDNYLSSSITPLLLTYQGVYITDRFLALCCNSHDSLILVMFYNYYYYHYHYYYKSLPF